MNDPAHTNRHEQNEAHESGFGRENQPDPSGINVRRYRKIRRFIVRVFLRMIWWDALFSLPVLRFFRKPAVSRWSEMASEYRELAVEMGGVLIKLGQFLSIRVDILPREVTRELAGLQDKVPAVPVEEIIRQMEADFGRPVSEVFPWVSREPLGAASLAQVHGVRLANGEHAVVKVLRPGIEVQVETDLAAMALAIRWLGYYKYVRRRMDLDWLAEEFNTVTRRELDLNAEGRSAECIARDLDDITDVYIPKIHWEYSAGKTLAMENVHYIRISDLDAIEAAGIRRSEVADILHRIYMRQVFETHFVHVDPHPGNLFVRPLPHPDEIEAGITDFAPGEQVPHLPDRPFQIVLVDFGMTSRIPERLRASLREAAIGIGTRDAHKFVKALVNAGTVLEGADLNRLEEAHEAMFERMWGVHMGRLRDVAIREAGNFFSEYRDLLYDTPLQVQVDMLFVMRAVGILAGMAANLDPDFDPWVKTIPWAERFAREELEKGRTDWPSDLLATGYSLVKLPGQMDNMLSRMRRGQVVGRASFAPDARKEIQRLDKSIRGLGWVLAGTGFTLSGTLLYINANGGNGWKVLAFLAVVALVLGLKKDRI